MAPGQPRRRPPAQLNKLVKRAAMVVPAIAVAGAVVAATIDHGPATPAPGAATDRVPADQRADAAHQAAGKSHRGSAHRAPSSKTADARRTGRSRGAAAKSARARAAQPGPAAPRAAAKSKPATLSCAGSSVMLPENYAAIVSFMTAHGYTKFAAAGMAGNMYQESKGNPESVGTGGGGLIGWTPLPAGFVTGNPAADLHTQLEAVLTYNQQWAQYIPTLNAATSATQAADVYMNYFERPGIPAASNREAAAAAVASACGF